jgi:hypothetical protein
VIPVQALNAQWTVVSGDAKFSGANYRTVNNSTGGTGTGVLSAGNTTLRAEKYNLEINGNQTYAHSYVKVQIPANAQPGDIFVIRAGIGTSGTGYTNTGSPLYQDVTLTVPATAVTPVDITGPAEGDTVTGSKPDFSGTGEPGATIIVRDDNGTELARTVVDGNGNWTVPSTVDLPDGPNHVVAEQTPDNGGATSTDDVNFIIVDDSPDTPVIDPAIAGGAGLALLAAAGTTVLIRRKKAQA